MPRRLLASVFILALAGPGSVAGGEVRSSERAAPRIILFHGGGLERPVVITNWWHNLGFLLAVDATAPVGPSAADTTGTIQVAMFWGNSEWEGVARDSASWPLLFQRLDQAQRARLLPRGHRGQPIFDYHTALSNPGLRTITAEGLAILHWHGMPLPGVNDSTLVAGAVGAFHASLSSGDSTGAMGWLAPDAVVLEAGTLETRQEYRDHHLGADMAYARSTRTTRGPVRVTVQGDVAWAVSTSESSRTVEGRTTRSSGAELMVLARTADGWRIRAIHWSSRSRRSEG